MTKQKPNYVLRCGKNASGEWLYNCNGRQLTSKQYTDYLEKSIIEYLGLKPAARYDDCNGIDFYDRDGKSVQLKILHNGKTSFTLPRDLEGWHFSSKDDDEGLYRSALWDYANRFDRLILYLGDNVVGTPFNPSSIVMWQGRKNCYKVMYMRCYRGYAQLNHSQAQFNKTLKSDLTERYLTLEKADRWREDILKSAQFFGEDFNRIEKVKKEYFAFKYQKVFADCVITKNGIIKKEVKK